MPSWPRHAEETLADVAACLPPVRVFEKPQHGQGRSTPVEARTLVSPELELPKLAGCASSCERLEMNKYFSYDELGFHCATRHIGPFHDPLQVGARGHSRGRLRPRCHATGLRPVSSREQFAPFRDRLLWRIAVPGKSGHWRLPCRVVHLPGSRTCAVHAGGLFLAGRGDFLENQPGTPRHRPSRPSIGGLRTRIKTATSRRTPW